MPLLLSKSCNDNDLQVPIMAILYNENLQLQMNEVLTNSYLMSLLKVSLLHLIFLVNDDYTYVKLIWMIIIDL